MSDTIVSTHAEPPQYLKQQGSGVVFLHTEELAKRADMAPHDDEPTVVDTDPPAADATQIGAPTPSAAQLAQAAAKDDTTTDQPAAADATTPVPSPAEEDDAKLARIQTAIDQLEETDFTGEGKPRVPALTGVLDEPLTAAERDAAWQRYQDDPKHRAATEE